MKKIINGRLYNTDTAEEIITITTDGYSMSDFHWKEETLYRKKTGEFFRYGHGGPATEYAERIGDSWTGGKNIIPMTIDEAKYYVETNCDTDTYTSLFGEVDE